MSTETYQKLQALAEPFVDTPDTVITKLVEQALAKQQEDKPGYRPPRSSNGLNINPDAADVAHTRLLSASIGGKVLERPNWNKLTRQVHAIALASLGSFKKLEQATAANVREGRYEQHGFEFIPGANISVQGIDATSAWLNTLGLARTINLPIAVEFEWRKKKGAAHPGKSARMEWTPTKLDDEALVQVRRTTEGKRKLAMTEFRDERQRATNYIGICENFADSYPEGTAHGLQKDAIQNAIDAAHGKGPVKVSFEVVENEKGRFLTIVDENTTGLTGPILDVEEYERELPEDANWARFESFAFTKDDPDAIGARGQGKFIFLHASKSYIMYYHTLRSDGIYRLGATQAMKTGCPMLPPKDDEPWEGDRGAQILRDECGLKPLRAVGARIILVDPKDEIVEAIASGTLSEAIKETWFRAIEKKRLNVAVSNGAEEHVELPTFLPLPSTDTEKCKIWRLGSDFTDDRILLLTRQSYRVKHFHAAYFSNVKVPERFRGIAIIHNGMKICSIAPNMYPPQARERLAGFVEFDRTLDQELRRGENQHPNHYDLNWRRRLPRAIKDFVHARLLDFGKEKLGIGVDQRELKKRRRANAEDWAMRQLVKHAKDLDLFGAKGKITKPPPPDVPIEPKPIGISINNLSFPQPEIAPRINWGSSFSGVSVTAYNRSGHRRGVKVVFSVLRADTDVLALVSDGRCDLEHSGRKVFGSFDIEVNRDLFGEVGEYRLKATLFDLESGDKIDAVARRFWVEQDPPLRSPFRLEPLSEFPEPHDRREWIIEGSINSSPTVYYNTSHPAYREAEEQGDMTLADYLLELMLHAAIQFVLERPLGDSGQPHFHPLAENAILGSPSPAVREEIPARTFMEAERYVSELRWRILQGG